MYIYIYIYDLAAQGAAADAIETSREIIYTLVDTLYTIYCILCTYVCMYIYI